MFEVQDLRFATLATVSRCGMVWFSEDVLTLDMIFENFLLCTRSIAIDDGDEGFTRSSSKEDIASPTMQVWINSQVVSWRDITEHNGLRSQSSVFADQNIQNDR